MKNKIYYASLDIGTSSIAAAISIRKESGTLELISLASQPLRAIKNGIITNLETVSEAIRHVITKAEMIAGINIPPLVINVGSTQSQGFQSHGIVAVAGVGSHGEREVTLNDIERVVEMANSVSVPAERVILHSIPYRFLVDHVDVEEPHGTSGLRLESEVYLVTQNKAMLESLHKVVTKAGYKVDEIILQSIASVEGVIDEEEKKMGTLLIDIGGLLTDYVFIKNNGIVLTGVIPVGSDHITKDLAYGLKTTFHQAELLKIKHGKILVEPKSAPEYMTVPLASQNRTARIPKHVLSQIIEPRVSELLTLIKNQVAKDLKNNNLYTSIVLTGGGALTQDIVEIAEDIFHLPARIGKPLITSSVQEDVYSPVHATLIGLQRLALEKWNRAHKPQHHFSTPHELHATHSSNASRSKLGAYFKNLFQS
ncbi:cell division protein FtsA [Spirochaetota bacterium]|nr:cell division protein FtsA [Spirochaetota bacterium]